jgi:signal transduction histidine kinase
MNPLRILHVEDSSDDSEIVGKLLVRGEIPCAVTRVETRPALFEALEKQPFDLILSDCKLPGFSGLQALEIAHALKPDVPFIFVSGTIGEETAIESLRNGAIDYVLKDSLNRLVPAVKRALAETEERRLCRQLQQRLREAGRLEAVSTLSNGIAHDFNNILTIILGHASLLNLESERPERVVELTRTITQAAERAAEVVQQLLAFARKSEGRALPTDLNHRLLGMRPMIKGLLPERIELVADFAPGLPAVRIDLDQLERMLSNIVTNAVDAMVGPGRLVLSTRVVAATDIPDLVPELASEKYVRLSITDNGPGMDPETREHIFEPFYTTKERGRGTGLGLPVVYGLMQAHNGWVDIESARGRGTTVSLFFPVLEATSRRGSSGADPALRGTETLLLIEDEAEVGSYLETVFQAHGYRTLLAANHEQALALFQRHRAEIRLVFSDVGLPRIDGISTCAELRRLEPELKVVLASGYSPKDFKERMGEAGIEAFVPKPYRTDEILRRVRAVLDEVPHIVG